MEGVKLAARGPRSPRTTTVPFGVVRLGERLAVLARLELPPTADPSIIAEAEEAVGRAGATGLLWSRADSKPEVIHMISPKPWPPAVVEVMDTKEVRSAGEGAGMLMVGPARMQDFSLLKELGRFTSRPVLLCRGWHATLEEWLNSAEYILLEGNALVVLCQGGIRTFEGTGRLVLDLSAVPALKALTPLPVFVDLSPSGGPEEIERMGRAAVAAGADGLLVPVSIASSGEGLPLVALASFIERMTTLSDFLKGAGDERP